jgi:hypothetical protein
LQAVKAEIGRTCWPARNFIIKQAKG